MVPSLILCLQPWDTADTISNDERSDIGEGLGSLLLLTSLIFAILLVKYF